MFSSGKKIDIHDYCNSRKRLKSTLRKQKAREVVGTGVSSSKVKKLFSGEIGQCNESSEFATRYLSKLGSYPPPETGKPEHYLS